ncbi:MAG: hypothetical protein KAG61_07415 [Bacteriovoracaceae bacterium]|nr:hypothetical protein [Bacteriovoracaceae bacterium]
MFAPKIWSAMMRNPILMIGILMMIIFLFTLRDKGYFGERYHATSCKSTLVMLQKRAAKNWSLSCDKNVLYATIDYQVQMKHKALDTYRREIYSKLANSLMFIATNALNESLERTYYVVVKLNSEYVSMAARTEGKHLAAMRGLAITQKDEKRDLILNNKKKIIAEHLHNNVEVQETVHKGFK